VAARRSRSNAGGGRWEVVSKSTGTSKWIALLVIVIIVLVIVRAAAWFGLVGVLTGAKPLRNVHPWDYIIMIVSIIIVIAALAYAWPRWKGRR